MKSKFICIVFLVLSFNLFSQVIPKNLGKLPDRIIESSGLIIGKDNTLWTHNDGGDSGYIYQLNMNLEIIKKLKITNSIDQDVEEITQDETHFYVNDMGNNGNNRTNLRIYKIDKNEAYSKDSVKAELIEFRYQDQDSFPPIKDNRNFDCEGFFALDSSLYLFSKNRGKSTYSKIYRLPKKAGNYQAILIDSIQTGYWVTSATISPNQSQIAILAGNLVYLISNFSGNKFSTGTISKFVIPSSQKEAIAFKNETTLLLSDEKNDSTDGCVYEIEITDSIRRNLKFNYFYVDTKNSDTGLYYFCYGLNPIEVEISINDMDNQTLYKNNSKTRVGRLGKIQYKIPKGKYRIHFNSNDIKETYPIEIGS